MLTPYQFASNTPIAAVDLDGLESRWYWYLWIEERFIETEPVVSGFVSDDIINAYGFYTESQAQKYARDIETFHRNRKRNQARAQAYEAQRLGYELDKLKNPAYAAMKFIHDAGPTGSGTQAYLNFDAGNTGNGLIYTALTLTDLAFFKKVTSLSRGVAGLDKYSSGSYDIFKGVNPYFGCINCELVALAVDRRLRGLKDGLVAAGDFAADKMGVDWRLKQLFGKPLIITGKLQTPLNSARFPDLAALVKEGDTGIVTASATLLRDGHAFNITRVNGVLHVLDVQKNTVAVGLEQVLTYIKNFSGSSFRLYKTN